MSEISRFNPMGRFTGLAEIYARCRPGYPEAAIEFIATHCGLKPESLMVDVGSGTGIASRLFAGRGVRVVGVEPNPNMRAEAEATDVPAGDASAQVRCRPGRSYRTRIGKRGHRACRAGFSLVRSRCGTGRIPSDLEARRLGGFDVERS